MKLSWQSKGLMMLIVGMLLPLVALVLMLVWPLTPIEIRCLKITNQTTIIAGDQIHYAIDMTKYINVPGKVIRQLVNERVTTYSPIDGNVSPGTRILRSSINTSPSDMPGAYKLRWSVTYTYWGFRDVTVSAESEPFTMRAHPAVKGERGQRGIRGEKGERGGFSLFPRSK